MDAALNAGNLRVWGGFDSACWLSGYAKLLLFASVQPAGLADTRRKVILYLVIRWVSHGYPSPRK
jgi:hypothetical protein